MTTTLERLDRATHQRKWTDELRRYRDEAADRWMGVWTEWRAKVHALHTDPPPVVPDEWPEPRHVQRYRLWVYARDHGKLAELEAYYEASLDDTRDWAVFVDAEEPKPVASVDDMVGIYGPEWTGGLSSEEWVRQQRDDEPSDDADNLIQPTSVIPAERPATQGEKDVAALKTNMARILARPRPNPTVDVPLPIVADEDLAGVPILPRLRPLEAAYIKAEAARKAGWTPDPGEYMNQLDIADEPWHRRTLGAIKRAVLRLDAWAERLGEDRDG